MPASGTPAAVVPLGGGDGGGAAAAGDRGPPRFSAEISGCDMALSSSNSYSALALCSRALLHLSGRKPTEKSRHDKKAVPSL